MTKKTVTPEDEPKVIHSVLLGDITKQLMKIPWEKSNAIITAISRLQPESFAISVRLVREIRERLPKEPGILTALSELETYSKITTKEDKSPKKKRAKRQSSNGKARA